MTDPTTSTAVSPTALPPSTTTMRVRHVAEIGYENGVQCRCGWRGSYREWREHKKLREVEPLQFNRNDNQPAV